LAAIIHVIATTEKPTEGASDLDIGQKKPTKRYISVEEGHQIANHIQHEL
jgi:hypothetical protein